MTVAFPTVGGVPLFNAVPLDLARASLFPASFRGVPFHVEVAGGAGGRRTLSHSLPLRDQPYLEDLGRRPRVLRLTLFVCDPLPGTIFASAGGNWLAQRDALLTALEEFDTAGTLIHPTMGALECRIGGVIWEERLVEGFGAVAFNVEFLVEGAPGNPIGAANPVSALLGGVGTLLPLISSAYETLQLGEISPALLLGTAASAMLGLPPQTVLGVVGMLPAITETPLNLSATANAVQAAVQAMAQNVLTNQPVPVTTDNPVAGTPFYAAPPADPSGGLLGLASFRATLPPVTGAGAQGALQAAAQAGIVALIQGNATAAVAQVYAQLPWPTQQAALAAQGDLLSLLDAQVEAAASAGGDDLYRGWRALSALAMQDMITRAQALPSLGSYLLGDSYPAPVVSQILYQTATDADQLAALNAVPHPLFMPASGLALVA